MVIYGVALLLLMVLSNPSSHRFLECHVRSDRCGNGLAVVIVWFALFAGSQSACNF